MKKYQIPIIGILIIIGIFLGYTLGKYTNTEAEGTYQFQSNEITFEGSAIGLSATNVKDAVDQIYQLYQSNAGKCPEGFKCIENNFLNVYVYNTSSCLIGSESGCVETTCYKSGVCPVGTIVDYFVNDFTLVRFHVLYDNGSMMVMQAQKNTIYNTNWNSSGTNGDGPTVIMNSLKSATSGWVNVNPIIITGSTTSFLGVSDIANSCSAYNSCSGNKYNINKILGTYKARIITFQEATDDSIGNCKYNQQKSCKAFMNNFLYRSTSNCNASNLCQDDNGASGNYGYWTLGADHSDSRFAWYVDGSGYVNNTNTTLANIGARAVVHVTK